MHQAMQMIQWIIADSSRGLSKHQGVQHKPLCYTDIRRASARHKKETAVIHQATDDHKIIRT
jgi:hypothetical protein